LTGLLSHAAYDPGLGSNEVIGPGGLDVVIVDWPTSPAWLYALNQGLHVATGIAAIPLLLAKLWSVIPKLYEWPPVRSIAHGLERLSLALLVGGSLFVFFTGVLNIQVYYPWKFNFVSAHWYGAWIFVAALALHVALKVPTIRRAFRDRGVLRPLRDDLAHTRPEPFEDGTTAPLAPAEPTISRRGLIASLGAACAALLVLAGGQSIGGPLRRLSFLGPRGDDLGSGPNSFQVNKTAAAAAIDVAQTSPAWRLRVAGPGGVTQLSREDLLRMPQATERLPIACVEGWSTTQEWTGVRLAELAAIAGADGDPVLVESLQRSGAFRQATLHAEAVRDERSLLALKVNGADLSLDHGFPARVIVPALPGVHCTKWVASMQFGVA
jgi:DMSO/TMAO reductase YedYZ molybdopterin-dependent catalytic subunit